MEEDISGLDPCCMREIIDRKRAATLREKLKKIDRTDARKNANSAVFKDVKKYHMCTCCKNSGDYILLEEIRKKMLALANIGKEFEFDDDELGDFVSEYELTLKVKFEENRKKTEEFNNIYGFGNHLSDSIEHLEVHIQLGHPIVCHICIDTDVRSAILDLTLESIAKLYRGTKFRRIFRNDINTK